MNHVCEGFTPDMFATTPPVSSSRFKLRDWSSGGADCPSVLLENPVAESLLLLCLYTLFSPFLGQVYCCVIYGIRTQAKAYCHNDIHECHQSLTKSHWFLEPCGLYKMRIRKVFTFRQGNHPTVKIVVLQSLLYCGQIWPSLREFGQYFARLCSILPARAIYRSLMQYISCGLKFTFLHCSMAYIALAVPLIRPQNGIQYYIKVPVSAKFGMLLKVLNVGHV